MDRIDAATVVTPTVTHAQVAGDLLAAGKDVLCEKPMTATLEEADRLLDLAVQNNCILQVGHLERFNPAVEEAFKRVSQPLFLECDRIAPFKGRALDVDVTLDLMIHDLDIILSLVGEEPIDIRAVGWPILGEHADTVNARLEFPSGCVANITASRLALKDERKMRIFQPDAYIALDFKNRSLLLVDSVEYRPGQRPKIKAERPRFGESDPLQKEIKAFVESVATRRPPRVGGEEGRRALACALEVQKCVAQGLKGREGLLEATRRWVKASGPEED
jgi:predicted dehydrogenase